MAHFYRHAQKLGCVELGFTEDVFSALPSCGARRGSRRGNRPNRRRSSLSAEIAAQPKISADQAPWHFLNFLPEPHQQGSLRPTFWSAETVRWPVATDVAPAPTAPAVNAAPPPFPEPFPPAAAFASAPASASCSYESRSESGEAAG